MSSPAIDTGRAAIVAASAVWLATWGESEMWARRRRRVHEPALCDTWLCPACGHPVEVPRPGRTAQALGTYRLRDVRELVNLCGKHVFDHHDGT